MLRTGSSTVPGHRNRHNNGLGSAGTLKSRRLESGCLSMPWKSQSGSTGDLGFGAFRPGRISRVSFTRRATYTFRPGKFKTVGSYWGTMIFLCRKMNRWFPFLKSRANLAKGTWSQNSAFHGTESFHAKQRSALNVGGHNRADGFLGPFDRMRGKA